MKSIWFAVWTGIVIASDSHFAAFGLFAGLALGSFCLMLDEMVESAKRAPPRSMR